MDSTRCKEGWPVTQQRVLGGVANTGCTEPEGSIYRL